MIPGYRADEVWDDLALDINEGGDLLRILPLQMGQQSLEVEVHVAPAGLGLQSVLIGYDELAQTLHHLREDAGGDETIVPYFLSPLCPPKASLSASSRFSPHIETARPNVVQFFYLTAFCRLGTVILESKPQEVCLIKPCRYPCKLKAELALKSAR